MTYPFLTPDSFDWIANGFFYKGYDVYSSFRAPGLPMIIAFLENFRILNFLPLLNQIILASSLVILYKMLRIYFKLSIVILTMVIVFFNFFIQNISLYILADIYAAFLILLGFFFYIRGDNKRNYILASLFWALSFLFQYALFYFLPAIFLHFIIFKRKINRKYLLLSTSTFIAVLAPWFIYKKLVFGSMIRAGNRQIEFINFHFDSAFFYLFNMISSFGILFFTAILVGLFLSSFVKTGSKKLSFLYSLGLILASWTTFWVFTYDGNDKRFIIYIFFFLVPFLSIAIEYFLNLMAKTNVFGKVILILLFLAIISSSSIAYESPFVNHILKFTNEVGIKFNPFINRKYYNINLEKASLSLIRDEKGFNSVNFFELNKLKQKKINKKIKRQLDKIKNRTAINDVDLCIKYAEPDGHSTYVEKNKFSNFFKRKVKMYPKDCNDPTIYIQGDTIKFSK